MGLIASHEDALRALQGVDLCAQVLGGLVVPSGTPCPCPFCALRRIDASYLDSVQSDVAEVLSESIPSKTDSVDYWDSILGLPPAPGLTIEERRDRIISARRKSGGLSLPYFLQVATDLGYTITIERGIMPLRAGIAKAGDPIVSVNRSTTANPLDLRDLRNGVAYPVSPLPTGHGDLGAESAAEHVTNPPYPSDFWTWVVTIVSLGLNADSSLLKGRFEALKPAYSVIVWKEPSLGVFIDAGTTSLAGRTLRIINAGTAPVSGSIPIYDFPETP